jgi:hypothetical protein
LAVIATHKDDEGNDGDDEEDEDDELGEDELALGESSRRKSTSRLNRRQEVIFFELGVEL